MQPPVHDGVERRGVEVVVFVPTFTPGGEEPDGFEHREVLGDRLSGEGQFVVQGEAGAEFEQRLTVPLAEGVEDGAPGGGGERFEQVGHALRLGKPPLACQGAGT